jgi:hypothetical protein
MTPDRIAEEIQRLSQLTAQRAKQYDLDVISVPAQRAAELERHQLDKIANLEILDNKLRYIKKALGIEQLLVNVSDLIWTKGAVIPTPSRRLKGINYPSSLDLHKPGGELLPNNNNTDISGASMISGGYMLINHVQGWRKELKAHHYTEFEEPNDSGRAGGRWQEKRQIIETGKYERFQDTQSIVLEVVLNENFSTPYHDFESSNYSSEQYQQKSRQLERLSKDAPYVVFYKSLNGETDIKNPIKMDFGSSISPEEVEKNGIQLLLDADSEHRYNTRRLPVQVEAYWQEYEYDFLLKHGKPITEFES